MDESKIVFECIIRAALVTAFNGGIPEQEIYDMLAAELTEFKQRHPRYHNKLKPSVLNKNGKD